LLASEIVAAVVAEGGFDTTSSQTPAATVLSWVNAKYRQMVADSKWRKAVISLGPTVAGQSQYAVPDNVVDLRTIRVNGSRTWALASIEGLWGLQASDLALSSDAVGAFASSDTAAGGQVIELYPAPDTSGYAIDGMAALLPTDLALTDTPIVPADLHQALVDGAIGMGMGRVFERHDAEAVYEQRFQDGVQKLMRRTKSRIGSGPMTFPVG
jgi:hypothetical protein